MLSSVTKSDKDVPEIVDADVKKASLGSAASDVSLDTATKTPAKDADLSATATASTPSSCLMADGLTCVVLVPISMHLVCIQGDGGESAKHPGVVTAGSQRLKSKETRCKLTRG